MNYVTIDDNKGLTWGLGIAGLLPFVIALALELWGGSFFGISASTVFVTYSALICSFLAGTLWGVIVNEAKSKRLLVLSNMISLLAWVCLLAARPDLAIAVLVLLYPALYIIESRMVLEHTPTYIHMRKMLTIFVVILHCVFFAVMPH